MHSSSRFSPLHKLATWINNEIVALYVGSLALVMATGIISNALFFEGYRNGPDWLTRIFFDAVVAAACGLNVSGISHRTYQVHSRSDIR